VLGRLGDTSFELARAVALIGIRELFKVPDRIRQIFSQGTR
jgi:hypothetical protein